MWFWGPLDPRADILHFVGLGAEDGVTPLLRVRKVRPATWHCTQKYVGSPWNVHVEAFRRSVATGSFHRQ
jgi:hypothetical protein